MNFTVSNMWVDSFSLVRSSEPTSTGEEFTMNIESGIEFNPKDKTQFRFAISLKLHKNQRFIFNACQMAIVKFDKEMSEEEAKSEISTATASMMLYPYLRAFSISTLRVAGYNEINLPIVHLK